MEQAGCEAGFVGTGGVVGTYTGMADVGTMSMPECVQVAGWIAQAVSFPVMMDGDTGHGGVMAVRRMIRDSIHAGIAGIRIDDQPIEGKRKTQSAGMEVVAIEQAVARYRAAVEYSVTLDPGYPHLSYGSDAKRSLIAKVTVSRSGIDKVSYLPVIIDRELRPEPLRRSDSRFAESLRFMSWVSEGYGAELTPEGNEVRITPAASE